MSVGRQLAKEFVNFVLPDMGKQTITCKQNHENSE